MFLREGRDAGGLRDLHGASRALAYLSLAGAPYVLVTSLLFGDLPAASFALVVAATVFMVVAGTLCWWCPARLPRATWYAAPALATALITALNLATGDASTGAQLFYLWPVLYAANFFVPRLAYPTLALVYAGDGWVVLSVEGVRAGLTDWLAMVLATSMIAIVVTGLRSRADRLRAELEQQANADPLTGLANRRSFTRSLGQAGRWARRTGRTVALISIDLDHFKAINDTHGHHEGDRVLRVVADAMRAVTGTDGLAARLGGDEFVLLLAADHAPAVATAEALTRAVAGRTDLLAGAPSVSVGVAFLPGDANTVEELVAASDAALYEAKTKGRGRVEVGAPRHHLDGDRPAVAVRPVPRT